MTAKLRKTANGLAEGRGGISLASLIRQLIVEEEKRVAKALAKSLANVDLTIN